jgi:hypothetical protein
MMQVWAGGALAGMTGPSSNKAGEAPAVQVKFWTRRFYYALGIISTMAPPTDMAICGKAPPSEGSTPS